MTLHDFALHAAISCYIHIHTLLAIMCTYVRKLHTAPYRTMPCHTIHIMPCHAIPYKWQTIHPYETTINWPLWFLQSAPLVVAPWGRREESQISCSPQEMRRRWKQGRSFGQQAPQRSPLSRCQCQAMPSNAKGWIKNGEAQMAVPMVGSCCITSQLRGHSCKS